MSRSIKKGPFVAERLEAKVLGMNAPQRKEGREDLVAREHDPARVRRAHVRRAQRQQVHPGLRDGKHGRPQAGRVLADAPVPRSRGQQGGRQEGDRRAEGRQVSRGQGHEDHPGIEARAIQRTTRQSPYKMRLVIDQIRGQRVNDALALLKFSKKHAPEQIEKTLLSAVANAAASGPSANTSRWTRTRW